MRRSIFMPIAAGSLILASCATAPGQAMCRPALNDFLERREICDHLRGEIPDPDDPESVQAAIEAINQHCRGTDEALRRMKARCASDPDAMARLNALAPRIERKAPQTNTPSTPDTP